jgi:hypothetical protein
MRGLAIVGNYTGIHQSPVFQTNAEIWGFGGRGPYLPRIDVLFQLHLPYTWEENFTVWDWLKNNKTIPVYMRQVYPEFPASILYPFEDAFALASMQYFTSSPAYALALAILQGRKKISIHGIELVDREYETQKDCIAFWLGFAKGRGVEIELHCMDSIFKRPLYGAQREP